MAAFRFLIRGRVQGVGFRYFVLKQAEALGVSGFARNLADGGVEVLAEAADEAALHAFEERLKEGPSFSRVETVDRAPAVARVDPGFHIR